jgi:hypothetical protein
MFSRAFPQTADLHILDGKLASQWPSLFHNGVAPQTVFLKLKSNRLAWVSKRSRVVMTVQVETGIAATRQGPATGRLESLTPEITAAAHGRS